MHFLLSYWAYFSTCIALAVSLQYTALDDGTGHFVGSDEHWLKNYIYEFMKRQFQTNIYILNAAQSS